MSANNSLLLICGFVVFTTSAVLLARFQFFELFTISANESYTLPAGSNMQQRVKIVSESREVRLFFPQAMSSRLVKVIVQQDNDDAPGEDISTKIVQPHRESSRSSLRIKIPRTPAEHIWISIASADGEPIEVFAKLIVQSTPKED
ncbi:MAG: hypothetical protein HYR90_00345 [Candidatus Andersenbacteria bacterium]|nr:hypothetical protein [Candidatus Andersenbacteria bacterium]